LWGVYPIDRTTQHPDSVRLARAVERSFPYLVPWSGDVYRSTSPKYAGRDDLITGAGAKANGGRWNPPGSFHTIYASLDPETALAEALAHFRRFGFPIRSAMPRIFAALQVKLNRVLDLRLGTVRSTLRVSTARLFAEEWWKKQERGQEALTQAIGRVAWEAGLEGMLVPSAAHRAGSNLIVFPANIHSPSSWVRILNPAELP
jgi:RES domain-containing protein